MDIKELLQFIVIEDERLKKYYGNYPDQEKRILARTVKLSEELGELCDGVLSFNAIQRKAKLENYNGENLSDEFADVLITTLLLAKVMNVDIEEALKMKVVKINKRYEDKEQ
jgi:NTP pyrophosphatase (non-canonical NTP hydrolase)